MWKLSVVFILQLIQKQNEYSHLRSIFLLYIKNHVISVVNASTGSLFYLLFVTWRLTVYSECVSVFSRQLVSSLLIDVERIPVRVSVRMRVRVLVCVCVRASCVFILCQASLPSVLREIRPTAVCFVWSWPLILPLRPPLINTGPPSFASFPSLHLLLISVSSTVSSTVTVTLPRLTESD